MKLLSKSEWFLLESPIGEPEIDWKDNSYIIERIVKQDSTIIWFGQGTNWVKKPDESWTKLSTNESVMPNPDGTYPSERSYFAPCEMPIYEKMYMELR